MQKVDMNMLEGGQDLQAAIAAKADKIYVDSLAESLGTGSPKGVYATLTALQTAFPSGNENIYLVSGDGKWYFWSGSAWTAGGTYQATGLASGSVTVDKIADGQITLNKTSPSFVEEMKAMSNDIALIGRLSSPFENIIYGGEGTRSFNDMLNFRSINLETGAFSFSSAKVSLVDGTFTVQADPSLGYFFVNVRAAGSLAVGNKFSLAVEVPNVPSGLALNVRLRYGSTDVAIIPMVKGPGSWYLIKGADIIAPTTVIQIRIDFRQGATGTSMSFKNLTLVSGEHITKTLPVIEDLRTTNTNIGKLERDSRVNYFPDPLFENPKWYNYLSHPSFTFTYERGEHNYLVLTHNAAAPEEVQAVGYDFEVKQGYEIKEGDTIEVDFSVSAYTKGTDGYGRVTLLAYGVGEVELRREALQLIAGKNTLSILLPANTAYFRLRWDIARPGTTYRIDTVNVSKKATLGSRQVLPPSTYSLKKQFDDILRPNHFPSPSLDNLDWINYKSTETLDSRYSLIRAADGSGRLRMSAGGNLLALGYDFKRPPSILWGSNLVAEFKVSDIKKDNAGTIFSWFLIFQDALGQEIDRKMVDLSNNDRSSITRLTGVVPTNTEFIRLRWDAANGAATDYFNVTDVAVYSLDAPPSRKPVSPVGEVNRLERKLAKSETEALKNITKRILTTGGRNLLNGWDDDTPIADINANRSANPYHNALRAGNGVVREGNEFVLPADPSHGYWFYDVNTTLDLAPGKVVSVAIKSDQPYNLGAIRFRWSGGNSPYYYFSDFGNGWWGIDSLIVPPLATFFEFRIDNRTNPAAVPVRFQSPIVVAGSFLASPLQLKVEREFNAVKEMTKLNYFPDPLLLSQDWVNYSNISSLHSFETIDGKGSFNVTFTGTNAKEAVGYRAPLPKGFLPGDVMSVQVQLSDWKRRTSSVITDGVLIFYGGASELGRKVVSLRMGANNIELAVPVGTTSYLIRFDIQDNTTGSLAGASYYKISKILVVNKSYLRNPESVTANVYMVKDMIDSKISGGVSAPSSTKVAYISPTGNDSTGDGTQSKKYKSLTQALASGANFIIADRGDYIIDDAIIKSEMDTLTIVPSPHQTFSATSQPDAEKVRFIGADPMGSWTPYNTIFKQSYAGNTFWTEVFVTKVKPPISTGTRPSFNASLYEDHLKLEPVLTLAECETKAGTFFWDGTDVYLNPTGGSVTGKSYFATKVGSGLRFSNIRSLIMQDVVVAYTTAVPFSVTNVTHMFLENCEAHYSLQGNGFALDNSNGIVLNCKASWNRNDGFNIHAYGDTLIYNCDAWNNYDDGISHHDGATGIIYGGRWYNNGKGGIIPTYGCYVHTHGAECFGNLYGIYYGGTEGTSKRRTIQISDCLCYDNQYGIYVAAEYKARIRNCVTRNNAQSGIAATSNADIEVDACTIVDNAGDGLGITTSGVAIVRDSKISDNRRGITIRGTGMLRLSRNHILYSIIAGINYESGTVIVDKRNNLYGNPLDYEKPFPSTESAKNVSIPML